MHDKGHLPFACCGSCSQVACNVSSCSVNKYQYCPGRQSPLISKIYHCATRENWFLRTGVARTRGGYVSHCPKRKGRVTRCVDCRSFNCDSTATTIMFANVAQPSIVSLFSSTGSAPLQLFSRHVDPAPALRSDSLILLLNDSTNSPPPPEPGMLVRSTPSDRGLDNEEEDTETQSIGRTLCQTVLHIQSPTIRTTYIRCPPHRSPSATKVPEELGLTLPWMHMQVCRLGEREWAFEVGIADRAGRKGIIRCSTFQVSP